jgi:hypothetical protein
MTVVSGTAPALRGGTGFPACQTRRSARWLLLLIGLLCACGADGRYVVIGSARASSTSGTVEVDELDGENTQVSVHLEFLHPPSHIDPSLGQYVVWFVPKAGATVRGGALKFDPAQRTGNLTATSPFRHFAVKITAERPGTAKAPSEYVVATQDIALD